MNNQQSISEIIKQHISLRGKTIKEVAYALQMNTKTLYDQLQHDRISASKLLDLAAYLDIDLEILKNTLGYNQKQSYYHRIQAKRMGKEYKDSVKEDVLKTIQIITKEENENSLYERVMSEYNREIFFLLDVLLDDDYEILITNDDSEVNKSQKITVKRNVEYSKLYSQKNNLALDFLERGGETVLKELIKMYEVKNDMVVICLDNEVLTIQNQLRNLDCESSLELGRKYHNERKYVLSIVCFNHIIEVCDQQNEQDLINLKFEAAIGCALALLENGDVFEAETEFNKLLSIYKDNVFIHERLLEIYERTNNFLEGNRIINELLQEGDFCDYSNDELLAKKLYFLSNLNDSEEEIKCCNLIIKSSYDREFRKYARIRKECIDNESK